MQAQEPQPVGACAGTKLDKQLKQLESTPVVPYEMIQELAKSGKSVPWEQLRKCAAQELKARANAGLKPSVESNRASAVLPSTAGKSDPPLLVPTPGRSVECSEKHEMEPVAAPEPSDSDSSTSSQSGTDGCRAKRRTRRGKRAARRAKTRQVAHKAANPVQERILRVDAHSLPNMGTQLTTNVKAFVGWCKEVVPVLIDTGATHSLMDERAYERLRSSQSPKLSPVRLQLKGAFNEKQVYESMGIWPGIPVKIGDIVYKANFHVVPNTDVPIILGTDFLVEYDATIKCGNPQTIRLRSRPDGEGNVAHVSTTGAVYRCAVVPTDSSVHLAPKERKLVDVQLDKAQRSSTVCFEPLVDLGSQTLVPPQLLTVDDQGKATVYVENRGHRPIRACLRYLGKATPLDVGDETSRHPGALAIYKPVTRIKGNVGKPGSRCTGPPSSVYGFIHHMDVESLRENVEKDGHSGVPVDHGTSPCEPSQRRGDPERVPAPVPAEGTDTGSRSCPPNRKGTVEEEQTVGNGRVDATVEPGSEGGVSVQVARPAPSPSRPDGPGGHSTVSAGSSLPSHLCPMMPPATVDLTPERKAELESLVKEYEDCFIAPGGEVGWTDRTTHVIDVGNALPKKIPPRKTSFAEKDLIENTVRDLLKSGKIRPSNSPWASPIVLVRKKGWDNTPLH